ncbi:alcohol dehydrogenase [Microbacterium sp. PMB16]|uniref:alcohol dehydrogenase n=1 Tax=Microbacterium sp. PMB16 TaxID=3120157 RepID=UPI003F4C1AA6
MPQPQSPAVRGHLIVIAGGTSEAGSIVAPASIDAGARVVVVGNDDIKLQRVGDSIPGGLTERVDLSDEDETFSLAHQAFDEDLRLSNAGRTAIVSSTSVLRPLAGGANYAAVKAASGAWRRAVGQGFTKFARDTGSTSSLAVILRVRALLGLERPLADAFLALWDEATIEETLRAIETTGEPLSNNRLEQ